MKSEAAFWDASAIVPLCCHQDESLAARRLARQYRKQVVWWGTRIEARSAIQRLFRERELTAVELRQALAKLAALRASQSVIFPLDELGDLAEEVLDKYALRVGDALQLAAALIWCHHNPKHKLFVCFDLRLAEAARKAGFSVLP